VPGEQHVDRQRPCKRTFLNANFFRSCSCLRSQQLLQIAYCVVLVALDADLFAESIVANHLYHCPVRPLAAAKPAQIKYNFNQEVLVANVSLQIFFVLVFVSMHIP